MIVRRDATKSHRVGRATLSDGTVTTAYRAIAEIACARCGHAIKPDALFSRQTRPTPVGAVGLATTTVPVCMTCRPLRLDDAGETTDARED